MNPNINEEMVEPTVITTTIKTPHPVHTNTPLSRYFAMALFIVLPFVGAYVGYRLAPEKVVEVQIPVVSSSPIKTAQINPLTVLTDVPSDAQHILFNGKKTGYFVSGGFVYYGGVDGSINLPDGDFDWVVTTPATLVPNADAKTFKVIAAELAQVGSLFAIDAHNAFVGTSTLPNVDVATVETFGKGEAFMISDKGLYLGSLLIGEGKKSDIEVFVINASEEMSPFNVYVHNKTNNTWVSAGPFDGVKSISAPKSSDLTADFRLYPDTHERN